MTPPPPSKGRDGVIDKSCKCDHLTPCCFELAIAQERLSKSYEKGFLECQRQMDDHLRESYWMTTGNGKMEFNHMLDEVIKFLRALHPKGGDK